MRTQGGPFYEMIFLLGRAETLRRLEAFANHISTFVLEREEGEHEAAASVVVDGAAQSTGVEPSAKKHNQQQ